MDSKLSVLFVAAEATPFSKVGGLADFAGSLPGALRELGVDARLMLPRHRNLSGESREVSASFPVPLGRGEERTRLIETEADGVPVYMLYNDRYFGNRDRVYGFNDDPQRFVFFSRAVISAISHMDWHPDIIHANDWHTAPISTWIDLYGRDQEPFDQIATVFTIHSMAYQGLCGRLILNFGRMEDVGHLDIEPPGKVNWLAQGICHSDVISTGSPTYAREVMTPEVGGELSEILRMRENRFFGVLSGIDQRAWDPSTDPALPQTFDIDTLRMREVNKTALQRELRLPTDTDIPLLSIVTRLDPIKGLDLIVPALETLMREREAQFVLLGTGNESYAQTFRDLQAGYPRHVRAIIRFDERLARQIYGGADLFVMPSRSEAGSTGVMIAMRYGAVPVVRSTGGLADTVVDVGRQPERGTGFSFQPYTSDAFVHALRRALRYLESPHWSALQTRAMERDFSWRTSAQAYIDIYKRTQQDYADVDAIR